MEKHCPNKNLPEFQKMAQAVGDNRATSVWYNNAGYPMWLTNSGVDSPLWSALLSRPNITTEQKAMEVMSYAFTEDFKAFKENLTLNEYGEPNASALLSYVADTMDKKARMAAYKAYNLLDKQDPTKPIKWAKTDANYKKVLGITQKINQDGNYTAKIIPISVAGTNKSYISIALLPKTAFISEEGEQLAHYDAATGTITFSKEGITAETVVHEFAHPFIDALAVNNTELFNNLLKDIKADQTSSDTVNRIMRHIETNYKGATQEIKDKELLAYVISEYGRGNIDPSTGKNTVSAIQKFFQWVTDLVKDLVEQIKTDKVLYVNQIHPKTSYKDLATVFTVAAEVGVLNLGVSPTIISEKVTPEDIAEDTTKRSAFKDRMAARKAAKASEGIPPAHKMIKASTVNFVDIKDEAAHMATLLPKEIAMELTPGYIKVLSGGRAVVGMFQDAMISLSALGPKGTAYHEGFHAVFRTLLSTQEQNAIIAEAKKTNVAPTSKDITDLQMQFNVSEDEALKIFFEEILADNFAEYMERPTSFVGKVAAFFKTIKDWIKSVFSNSITVNSLFRDIKLGKYKKQTPNIVKSIAYRVHPIFNVQEVNKITRELASIAFENIRTVEDMKTTKINLEEISNKLTDRGIELEEEGNVDLIEQMELLFDQETGELDKFWLREIDSYLRNSIGLKVKKGKNAKNEKITDEDQDEQNQEDLEKDNFLKSSYEVSGKMNAAATIKFMVAMTPQVVNTKPESPLNVENLEYVTSTLTGLPVLVDFGVVYNDLENILSGIVNVTRNGVVEDSLETMITTMKQHAKYKPELLFIADKIDNASEEVRSQFFNAFSRQKGSFVHHQIKGSKDKGNISSEFTTSNFSTKSTIIRDNWVAAFTKQFGKREGDILVYDVEKQTRFAAIQARLREVVAADVASVEAGNHKLPQSTIKAFETTLNFLGVTINPNTINYIVESRIPEDYTLDYDIEYAQQFETLVYEFLQATNDLIKREGNIFGNNNHIQDNSTFFKNTLAEADAYFKKVPGENAFVGPEGNSIYSYQDNDLVSKAVNAFKVEDLSHLEQVVKSAYGKNSLWANELLYGDKIGKENKDSSRGKSFREAFGLHMYGNLKSEETAGDTGAKASELKPGDAYMDNVNKTLSGYYIGLAEADKSRQTYFKGPKLRKMGFTLTTTEEGKPQASIKSKEGLTILKGYLADELSRMSIAHGVIKGEKPLPEKDWVLYYHYYPVAPGKGTIGEKLDKIPGNAFNSFLFPELDLIKHGLKTSDGTILARGSENFDNNKGLDAEILTAFTKLVQKEIAYALEVGLLVKEKSGNLQNRLISQDIVARYTQGSVTYFEQLMGDYVLNSIIGNIEQTKLFNGDPACYKVKGLEKGKAWKDLDLFGDFKKRVPAIFASGKDFRIFNKKDGTPVVRPYYTSAVIANIEVPSAFFGMKNEEGEIVFNSESMGEIQKATGMPMVELEKLFKPYLEINQTDAQAWITLDTYKERLHGLGKWTPEHQSAYDTLMAGDNLSPLGLKLLAQPLKTVHAELVNTVNNEMIMHYNKQSEAVLLPFMKNTHLGKLMDVMEKQGVDHVIVLDGKKAGASGITDIVDDNGQILDKFELNPTRLSYTNLFLQQDLPSKGIKDTLVGSQGTKNVMSVVALDEKYIKGTKTGREVIDTFHATLGRLSDLGLVELDDKIGYDSVTDEFPVVEGVSKVHKLVQKEFEGEASENHLSALNENISFDALPIKNKIMNKLQAIVTKKTVKLKQLGGALVQLSDLGFVATESKLSDAVKNGIIWFKNPTERLKPMHIVEGEVKPAQILIPHGKFLEMLASNEKLLKAMESKFNTRDYKDLSATQIKSFLSKDVLEGLSYRIPNQGPSSNDAFEIVGVLPMEMGDTMVAFSDVTTKTGSDFDIDKSFIVLPNFYYDNEAGKIKKTGYDINAIMSQRKDSLENLRLDLMREMLMHPAAYTSVMAPLDDPWLEKLAKDLFPEQTTLSPMEFFTSRYQLATKMTFDGAKALVGAIANHMTNHSLALADGLFFRDYYLGKGIKVGKDTSISNMKDEAGNSIANTLGAFMNAIVDAAKDPFISRANLNQYTAGTTFMLARTGVEREWITAFIGQPILKDVVEAQAAQEGRFGKPVYDSEKGKRLSAIEIVLAKYGLPITEVEFKGSENYGGLRPEPTSEITITKEQLIGDIKTADKTTAEYQKRQLKVLKQFLEWQSKASELNDVIKVSKADVEGATKTLMTAQLASNLLRKVLTEGKIGNVESYLGADIEAGQLVFKQGLEGKMIGKYFENSVEASLKRFSRFFIASSEAVKNLTTNIAMWAGYTELVTNSEIEKLVYTISNEIYAMTATDTDAFRVSPEDLKTLLYGSGTMTPGSKATLSIANRVEAAKQSELANNLLINGLQIKVGRDGAPDNVYLPNTETVKETKEALFQAWEEIFQVNENLAKDLIVYSFYSSGFSKSVGDFSEHIPNNWLKANNFHTDIANKNAEYEDLGALTDKEDIIFKNLYKDNQLVPVVSDTTARTIIWAKDKELTLDRSLGFMITQNDSANYTIGASAKGKVFKRYVKRKIENRDAQGTVTSTSYQLFKLAGYTYNSSAVYIRTNTLGISGYGNNIKEYNTDGKTSIFPQNNVSLPESLKLLVDDLEQRGKATASIYEDLEHRRITGSDVEERLAFCIMR